VSVFLLVIAFAAPTILFFETTNKEVSAEENLAVNLKLSQNEYKKR
jgi:hypothetical protein